MLVYSYKAKKTEEYNNNWSFQYNNKIYKLYRGHQDDNYIDGKFIEPVMRYSIGVKLEQMLHYDNTEITEVITDKLI